MSSKVNLNSSDLFFAEARADLIERAINKSAWEETSIVYWTMVGNQHIWDKERELHEVRRKGKRIQHSLKSRMGRSWNGESWEELPSGHRSEKWAWDSWVNDSFWLNPLVKVWYIARGSEPFFIGASQKRRAVGKVPALLGVP